MSNIYGFKNNYLVKTRSESSNNDFYLGFIKYVDNRPQIILFNTDIKYNPSTQTFSAPNINGLIDKVEVNNSDYNGNLKLVFSDGSNNLLDNNHLFYHPFFQQLKIEANNSQTYQLLLKNSGQSAGIQIKGQPTMTQYEANITHYQDVLKIQNTGSDTEIQQVGSGTIYIYNANGSLTLNSSGNLVASGIYAGNGSLLTSLTTSNLNGLIQNNQLLYSNVTIGNTIFNLGDTLTTITGMSSITSTNFIGALTGNASTATTATNSVKVYLTQKSVFFSGEKEYIFFNDKLGTPPYVETKYNDLLYYNGFDREFTTPNLKLTEGIANIGSNIKFDDTGNSYINTGDVGIGIVIPTAKLHVSSADGYIQKWDSTSSNSFLYHDSTSTEIGTNSATDMILSAYGQKMTLQQGTGNVGIGYSNPQYKLHIEDSGDSWGVFYNNTTYSIEQGIYASATGGFIGTKTNHDMRIGANNSTKMTINSTSGNVGIGFGFSPDPNNKLDVNGKAKFHDNIAIGVNPTSSVALTISTGSFTRTLLEGNNVYWDCDHELGSSNGQNYYNCRYDGNTIGYMYQNSTSSIAIYYGSDYRLKENVIEMDSMLDKIRKLKPKQFNYLKDSQDCLGFLAHEFKAIFPNNAIVKGEKDAMKLECKTCKGNMKDCNCDEEDKCCELMPDYQGMDYSLLTPICIKGIQELIDENETLKNRINILEENQKKIIQKLNKLLYGENCWFQGLAP